MKVLQITDCHLVAVGESLLGVDTQASLLSVLEQATADHEFDAVVASGDLAHDPQPSIYTRFDATVREYTDAPLLCLPGNHDVLQAMQTAQLSMQTLELGQWSIIALDSHIDDIVNAQVTEEDLQVTVAAIAAAQGTHLLLATHHPLVEVNSPWIDKSRIQDGSKLLDWLAEQSPNKSLRGVIFGHAHQLVDQTHRGLPLLGCPSTCFQFLPQSPKFALDDRSPGYRVLELCDDGSLSTTVRRTSFTINAQLPKRVGG